MTRLILEDGTVFVGRGFGSLSDSYGEIVFTTSMSGYMESITDPSYRGQILVFAFPTIANYPLSKGRVESDMAQVAGVITLDSHHSLNQGGFPDEFSDFLEKSGVPGIDGVDTRSLVRKIREKGVMRAWISQTDDDLDFKLDPIDRDLWKEFIPNRVYEIRNPQSERRILFIDTGAKRSLIKRMSEVCNLSVHPYNSSFPDSGYDAIFISNGPGDPKSKYLRNVVKFISDNIGKKKIFGVCLGQQLISLAYGAKTYKMKFGHRGTNHAVTDGSMIWITSHNHGYAVDYDSAKSSGLMVERWDANDNTPEMLSDRDDMMCVQYHPEASPGPNDTLSFFDMIKKKVDS